MPEPDDVRTWAGLFFCASAKNALGLLEPAKIFCLHSWRESGGAGLRRGEVDALGTLALGTSKTEEGFPGSSDGKESTCNAGDLGSVPGLGRFPWRRERLPKPGEFHRLCSPWGCKVSETTERLSLSQIPLS